MIDIRRPFVSIHDRSHSHSENDKRRPGRSRAALKSASELLSNDMVYCGLARDNHGDENEEDEREGEEEGEGEEDRESNEVFVGVDDARFVLIRETFIVRILIIDRHIVYIHWEFFHLSGITISRPVYRERVEEDTRSALSWARREQALVRASSTTCRRGNSRTRPVWRSLTRWRHLCRRSTAWTGRSGGRGPAADPGAGGIEALRARVSRRVKKGINEVVRNWFNRMF